MSFLLETDLFSCITEAQLDEITENTSAGGESAFTTAAMRAGDDTLKNHLFQQYDMDYELSRTGTERNQELISMATVIALYQLQKRLPAAQRDQDIVDDYDKVIKRLEALSRAEQSINLKRFTYTDSDGNVQTDSKTFVHSSSPKRNYRWSQPLF